ncbi:hypothetical protein [Candidatus Palauibacter sp.]|uniref:hypothetical protein n=1 Tax=Candidatus Palauibacter sp. TaxID=3101350 RepID=UPI003B5AD03F
MTVGRNEDVFDVGKWTAVRAGDLALVADNGQAVHCALILMSDWRTTLPDVLSRDAS